MLPRSTAKLATQRLPVLTSAPSFGEMLAEDSSEWQKGRRRNAADGRPLPSLYEVLAEATLLAIRDRDGLPRRSELQPSARPSRQALGPSGRHSGIRFDGDRAVY